MRTRTIIVMSAGSAALVALALGWTSVRPGAAAEVASLALVLWCALLLVVTVAYAFGRWPEQRWASLVPSMILLAAIPGVQGVRVLERELTDLSFGRHLSALEAMVEQLTLLPGGFVRLRPDDFPDSAKACCFRGFVRRDSEDRLSAVFVVRRRQLAYLYNPSGATTSKRVSRRWPHQELIAPHWYRLAR